MIDLLQPKKQFIPRPAESAEVIEARWKKKKESIENLSNNIRKLKVNVSKDIQSDDEKDALTALVVAVLLQTAERIGNDESAREGRVGVTGFTKEHISISGNTVSLDYHGKTNVHHEKSFTDERVSNALKRAIKNSSSKYIFETSDGFRIKSDRVARYLKPYAMKSKDVRGFLANKYTVEKLNKIEPEETDKKRKKQLNAILKKVAEKVGHKAPTLKKHYLIPELYDEFVQRGKIIDLNDLGYTMESGGAVIKKSGEIDFQKRLKIANEFGKIIGKHVDQHGNILVGKLSMDTYDLMKDLHGEVVEYADNDEEVAEFTIETFELDADSIKDKNKFGSKVNQCLNGIFDGKDIELGKGGEVASIKIPSVKNISDSDKKYILHLLEYVYYNNPEEDDEFSPIDAPDWIIKGSYEYLKNKGINKIYRGIADKNYHGEKGYSWTYNKKIAENFGDKIVEKPLPKKIISPEYVFDWVNKNKHIKLGDVSADFYDYITGFTAGEEEVIVVEKGGEVLEENEIKINASFGRVDCDYQIFEIVSSRKSDVARIVVRPQVHYDNKEFKGKIFSLDEFKKYYSGDKEFTYYYDWNGFNMPDNAIKKFLDGKFNPLSPEEKWLMDNIRDNVDTSNPYYILGYSNDDKPTVNHERAHALYYLSPEYKKEADGIVDSIPKSELGTLNEFLRVRNYHPSVYEDEMQAYLMADKDYLIKYNGWSPVYESYHQRLVDVFDGYFKGQHKVTQNKSFAEYYGEDGWLIF